LARSGPGFGRPVRLFEPFTETLKPRGEGGFFVRPFLVSVLAGVVSHGLDPTQRKTLEKSAALKAARTILTVFLRVKER
jgi:hypothetical protein